MDAATACAQLPLIDQTQWRYEVIRPLVLFADRTATQRAQETATHPETVRLLHRRFRQQGMLGLLPGDVEAVRRGRATTVPDDVRAEIDRLKALYRGFHYRELARMVLCKCAYPIDDKTVKFLWHRSPVPTQQQLELWTYHTSPDRYQARLQVIKLSYQGWDMLSISRFCRCLGRPWIPGSRGLRPSTLPGSWTKNVARRSPHAKSGSHGWYRYIISRRPIPMRGNS